MEDTAESTRKKVISSSLWTTNSKIILQVAGFLTTLVLVRILSREDFGIMAMAITFVGFVDIFIDLGFLSAIIQAKDIRLAQLSSCFWILLGLSLMLTLSVLFGASLISQAFATDRLASLIYWLAPLFLLAPFNIITKGILSRDLRLDLLSKIELYAGILKMGLSISLAFLGFGVLSLLLGFILERFLMTILLVFTAKWFPRFELDKANVRQLLAFGSKTTLSSLLWYIYTKADIFIIGRVLGAEILGVYTIASQFPQTIARLVPSTWHRILYPLFSRYQESPDLKQIVIRSSSILIVISLPLFVGLAALAPDIIHLLFGARWNDAVLPLQILSIIAAIETATWILTAAINAIGRPGMNAIINLVAVLIFPAILYIGALTWGIEGVLWASVIVYLYRFLSFLLLAKRFVHLSLSRYCKDHLGSILASSLMFIGVVVLYRGIEDWHIFLRLTTCIISGAIIYLFTLFVVSRRQISQFISYVRTA